jgi:L-lactate dehydrogenase (cytochrome)
VHRPELSPTRRRLANAVDIGDLRTIARRRCPTAVFDYVDGAASDEISLRRARQLYADLEFNPSVLRDVSDVDLCPRIPVRATLRVRAHWIHQVDEP